MGPAQGAMAVVRTVHCVADGPEIRHSKVQSAQVPMYPNLVPSLCVRACVCVRRGSRYLIGLIRTVNINRTFYLTRYNGPSLSDPGPPTHVRTVALVVYLPTGTGREENTQVAHTHTTPTQILSLLLLQHSRTLRVSALLPFATTLLQTDRRTGQQNIDDDTIYRRDCDLETTEVVCCCSTTSKHTHRIRTQAQQPAGAHTYATPHHTTADNPSHLGC